MAELEYDKDKVDEVALALLYLTLDGAGRAWKGMDWNISDRLHEKGWIENPRNKNKSFVLTSAGREACIRLFRKHFCKEPAEAEASGESPPMKTLPVDLEALLFIFSMSEDSRSEYKHHLDTFTGEIVGYESEEPDARYVPIPACGRKTQRKRVIQWLESIGIQPK